MSSEREIRLALIGNCGVGKSSLCDVFVKDRYSISYNPTEEQFYRQRVNLNGVNVMIDLIDVNVNSQAFKQTIMSADGYIFVYDITNRGSYDRIIELHSQIVSIKSSPFLPQILVGNKSDRYEAREVSFESAFRTATDWGCKFCEVSAKNNTQVGYIFTECANAVVKNEHPHDDTRRCCAIW